MVRPIIMRALYDEIGGGYASRRRADPTIAAAIVSALGDASSVVNVGAGTGSYEPRDREVVAVEPSAVMLAQRPADAARAIAGSAEALPFDDDAFDAALAVFSDHHWPDRAAGLRELRRVARRRVVIVNADPGEAKRFWLTTEYLPRFLRLIPKRYRIPGAWEVETDAALGGMRRIPLPIPHDCTDGFYGAYWHSPAEYPRRRYRQDGRLTSAETDRRMRRRPVADASIRRVLNASPRGYRFVVTHELA